MLYRLVTSPGRRALLGMAPRSGRLVRPLLAITADQARDYCLEAGPASGARTRPTRTVALPATGCASTSCRRCGRSTRPRSERARDDRAAARGGGRCWSAVDEAASGRWRRGAACRRSTPARLSRAAPPLRRLVLRRLAEQAAGGPLALSRRATGEIERLAAARRQRLARPRRRRAGRSSEYGVLRFRAGQPTLRCPSRPRWPSPAGAASGTGSCLRARRDRAATKTRLSRRAAAGCRDRSPRRCTVRAWRDGDRDAAARACDGSKSLQDLFTDRKVPRSLRHAPAGGRIRRRDRVGGGRGGLRATSRSPATTASGGAARARRQPAAARLRPARLDAKRCHRRRRRDSRRGGASSRRGCPSSAPRSRATTRAASCS